MYTVCLRGGGYLYISYRGANHGMYDLPARGTAQGTGGANCPLPVRLSDPFMVGSFKSDSERGDIKRLV